MNVRKVLLEEKISLAREVLNKGVSFCLNSIGSIDEISESLQKVEIQIPRKREVDTLLQTDGENLSLVVKYQKEVDFLQKIEDRKSVV